MNDVDELPRTSGNGRRARHRRLANVLRVIGAVVVLAVGVAAYNLITGIFVTSDRSGPVVIAEIQDLSRYEAASGTYDVVVDLKQDNKYVFDFIFNHRIVFYAVGTVDVYVDFSTISSNAITVSPDRTSVTIALPAPAMEKPNLDNTKSHILDEDRGVIQKVGDLFGSDHDMQQQVYLLGEQKIAEAARNAGIEKRAEDNTRQMLTGMMRSLGFTTVTVTFAPSPN